MLLLFLATDLNAEEVAENVSKEVAREDLPGIWGLRLVAFAQNFPAYPSSSEQNFTALPIPYPVYSGKIFSFGQDLDEIANGQLVGTDRFNLSVGLSASFPESSDNLDVRTGMPDLDFLVEAGPEVNVALKGGPKDDRELLLSLQVRAAVSFDDLDATGRGFVFNPELEYPRPRFSGCKDRTSLSSSADVGIKRLYGLLLRRRSGIRHTDPAGVRSGIGLREYRVPGGP